MDRETKFNLGSKPSAREKLNRSGYEALLGPEIDEISPTRTGYFLLALSEDGFKTLFNSIVEEVLEEQRQNWIDARRGGNDSPNDIDLLARESLREVYFELMNLRNLVVPRGGTNILIPMVDGEYDIPEPNVQFITILEAIEQEISGVPYSDDTGPAPDPLHPLTTDNPNYPYILPENWHLTDFWELQYLPDLPSKGEKGDQGDQGDQGIEGHIGIQGEPGPQGEPGQCEDCGPGGQPDGGGGGPPGGDGGGSGTGGEPNPDGQDKLVYIAGCPDPIINFPFCSDSFTFANAAIRGAITDAAESTGRFDPDNEILVSAVLDNKGAAYAGIAELTVEGEYDYLGPHSNLARLLSYTDAESNHLIVPHDVESFGVEGVLVVSGYHYDGTVGLRMLPTEAPITIDGQMSGYPVIGGANCHTPPDETDPAWLKVCLRQFVKRPKTCEEALGIVGSIAVPFSKIWTDPADPDVSNWELRADLGWKGDWSPNGAWRRQFEPQRYSRLNVYGFKPGKTYKASIGTGGYNNGNLSWAIYGTDWQDLGIGSANHFEPGDSVDGRIRVIGLETITMPEDWNRCSIVNVTIFYSGSDYFNDFIIEEV